MRRHCFTLFALTAALSPLAKADPVTDWNVATLNAIRAERTAPPAASRALAIVHAAIYDAVNGIERTHEGYLAQGHVPASASVEAAAISAAYESLSTLFPNQSATLRALYNQNLAELSSGPQVQRGIAWGKSVAKQLLAIRALDGWNASVVPPVANTPGDWVPTPPAFGGFLAPQWAFVVPFCMTGSAQFRPPPPPALGSAQYTADFIEVEQLGAARNSTRTADQTQIALFWADGAGTETPPGHWNTIAREIAAARGNTLAENARVFALLNFAMADAAICAWDAKYSYHSWRPLTAIRNAASDDNPATEPDPAWESFIVTPPFPDYISGHSTFSAAAATILAMYYGSDNIPFTVGSDAMPTITRSFSSLSAAAAEAASSRVYGGIHFRTSSDAGLLCGLNIGQHVMENSLLPKQNRSVVAHR